MGEMIGIVTALSVLNVLVITKVSNLLKPTTKLLRYGVALASSAITVFMFPIDCPKTDSGIIKRIKINLFINNLLKADFFSMRLVFFG